MISAFFLRYSRQRFSVRVKTGFTIIEIIMVIVVIGIMAAAAVPRIDTLRKQIKLQGSVKKLVSDIRYAQSVAISRHTNTIVIFDVANNSYRIEWYNDAVAAWQALPDPATRSSIVIDFDTDAQYSGMTLSSPNFGGTVSLRFDWEGVPQDMAGVALVAAGSVDLEIGGDVQAVTVTPQTGKVETP